MPSFADLVEHTLYINLTHRTDRLAEVVAELEKMGIRGTRFNAIKTANGAIGCSLSHLKCLEEAAANDWPYVFICEDDIVFLNPELVRTNVGLFCEKMGDNWDVLILGGNAVPPYQSIGNYAVRVANCQTTTGYIVNRRFYKPLIDNIREGIALFMRNPLDKRQFAIDIYWKRLQATHQWYMIVPPTVIQREGFSDVESRQTNYAGLMLDMQKEWLFRQQQQGLIFSNK
jgi:GR25 family glycosyltransferase involved in LPS biosynthesis